MRLPFIFSTTYWGATWETLKLEAGVLFVITAWAAWAYAIVIDCSREQWLWLAVDVFNPPAGVLRGVWLYSST